MSDSRSLFTRIIEGELSASFVAKGDDWVSFLDINPRRSGHTLVVPHQQVARLSDLEAQQIHSLMGGVVESQRRLSLYFGTSDFSVVVHDGPLAGQEIPHVHIHVIPRNMGDGGRSLLSMWPEAPGIGKVEPDFEALAALAGELRNL